MSTVPSNLVPTRITQLPEYQGGSLLGYVPYVLNGVTYKTQMAQLSLGSVTSVNVSGGTTGFTFSGGPITSSGTMTLTGTLAVANGGTGSATAVLARAALLPSYGGNALKRLTVNVGATDVEWVADGGGSVTSVAQSFTGGLISVAGSPITTAGTLALTVAGTSGGVPYFSSGTTWATSAALAANAIVIGGGAGVAPATTTTGAGVISLLAGASSGTGGPAGTVSPAFTTPALGAASATSVNKITLTAPLTGSTLTIADGKTASISNTLTFTGTDASSIAFGAGGTVLYSGGAYVSSMAGTANQITASASAGAVTLSLPSTLIAPGTFAATSGAFGGATIGGNALAVTGTSLFNNSISVVADVVINNNTGSFQARSSNTLLSSPATATWQLGAADVDTAPVAQTLRTQGTLTGGTSNVAGANLTIIASPGKGTGAGGSIIFQTASAGGSGNVPNSPSTALTIDSVGRVIATGSVTASGSNGFQFTGRSIISSTADGLISLGDNNNTAFSGLILGPSGTAYPRLKPSGTAGLLTVRLANDSADAPFAASTAVFSGASITSGVQQTTRGSLVLANTAAGAFPTTVASSNSATAAWTMTLPVTAGTSGQVLSTNGAGVTSWSTSASGLTVGTTAISSGTATRILYNNSGALGEYTLTGSGTVVAMQTSPSLTTPNINVATGSSLALRSATIGSFGVADIGVSGGGWYLKQGGQVNTTNATTFQNGLVMETNASTDAVGFGYGSGGGFRLVYRSSAGAFNTMFFINTAGAGCIMPGYGAGAATFDASGNLTSASDPSQKTKEGGFTAGLAEISKIAGSGDTYMGRYKWTTESGLDTENVYAGFYAADDFPVQDAVFKNNKNGVNSFGDRAVVMALCNAVKELRDRVVALEAATSLPPA